MFRRYMALVQNDVVGVCFGLCIEVCIRVLCIEGVQHASLRELGTRHLWKQPYRDLQRARVGVCRMRHKGLGAWETTQVTPSPMQRACDGYAAFGS